MPVCTIPLTNEGFPKYPNGAWSLVSNLKKGSKILYEYDEHNDLWGEVVDHVVKSGRISVTVKISDSDVRVHDFELDQKVFAINL